MMTIKPQTSGCGPPHEISQVVRVMAWITPRMVVTRLGSLQGWRFTGRRSSGGADRSATAWRRNDEGSLFPPPTVLQAAFVQEFSNGNPLTAFGPIDLEVCWRFGRVSVLHSTTCEDNQAES
jgi:hypothetical protein